MIPILYEEVEDLACKQQYLGDEYHFMDTIQSNEVEDMVLQPPTVEQMKSMQIHSLILGLVVQVKNVFCSHKLCQLRSWQRTWRERLIFCI